MQRNKGGDVRKRIVGGFALLILGIALVGISVQSNLVVSADMISNSADRAIKISLYIGLSLIIVSGLLFGLAVGTAKRGGQKK